MRGLDFNPIQANLLASGGVSGEVRSFLWLFPFAVLNFCRFTFGILKIPPNLTRQRQVLGVQNSMKLHRSRGINKSNMFSLVRVARGTLLYGISEGNVRSLPWRMEEAPVPWRVRWPLVVVWLLEGGAE